MKATKQDSSQSLIASLLLMQIGRQLGTRKKHSIAFYSSDQTHLHWTSSHDVLEGPHHNSQCRHNHELVGLQVVVGC